MVTQLKVLLQTKLAEGFLCMSLLVNIVWDGGIQLLTLLAQLRSELSTSQAQYRGFLLAAYGSGDRRKPLSQLLQM